MKYRGLQDISYGWFHRKCDSAFSAVIGARVTGDLGLPRLSRDSNNLLWRSTMWSSQPGHYSTQTDLNYVVSVFLFILVNKSGLEHVVFVLYDC